MAVPLIDPDLSTTQMISFRFEDSIGSILKSFGFKSSSSIAFLLPSLSSQISKLFGIHYHIANTSMLRLNSEELNFFL